MTISGSGEKVPLTLTPFSVDKSGTKTFDDSKTFKVMINPAGYSQEYSIKTNKTQAQGKSAAEPKFIATGPQALVIDIVIDGTGVVSPPAPDVKTQIAQLKNVAYDFEGKDHAPPHVKLVWGSFIFYGMLKTMTVEYTLFKPSGEPLRAKVKLNFIDYLSKEEESKKSNKQSPDLAHVVEVKAGDTLPLLCYRIYKDSSYYPEIARVNNLVNFRRLNPGDQLHFPPSR